MKSSSTQIARRYVDAIFPMVLQADALSAVEKDLTQLAALAQSDADFGEFLENPLFNREQQKSVIAAIAKKIGIHALTAQFLAVLAEQKRLPLIAEIASQFAAKAEETRGELTAEVISAAPLSDKEKAAVAERLGKAYGKKVKLITGEDPSLIGGMIVKIGSAQLDGSLQGKLNRLNIALKAA